MDIIKEIEEWNRVRNNTEFNIELERRMLDEEVEEFITGLNMGDIVEMVDAYCDTYFVYIGSVYKSMNTLNKVHAELHYYYEAIDWMRGLLTDIDDDVLDMAMEYVITANKAKPIHKKEGKVIKGDDWVDPKIKIQEILENYFTLTGGEINV